MEKWGCWEGHPQKMGVPITPLKLQATPWQLSLHRIAVAGAGVVGLSLEKWWGKNVYFFVDTPKHESTKVWCGVGFFLVPLWEPTTFIVTTWILYESIGAGSLGHYTWIIYRYSYISPLVLTWPKWTIHFGQIQCKNVHATTNIIKTPIIHTHLDIAMNLNK